jgi:hypothetical protein|tara:strand:+ start:50 stop:520 length:471 start_codon:yes stop_codon:yes gene_type:complete
MKVKHKDTKKEHLNMSMTLSNWQKEYYPNKKYLNYEFYDVPDIFDLYEIDETNGKLTYITSDFAHVIFPKVRENSQKFVYKKHDPKYLDEYLMPIKIDYLGSSFLKRLSKRIEQIIKPKKNPNTIPFTRAESMQIKIGIWSIAITAILFVIGNFII